MESVQLRIAVGICCEGKLLGAQTSNLTTFLFGGLDQELVQSRTRAAALCVWYNVLVCFFLQSLCTCFFMIIFLKVYLDFSKCLWPQVKWQSLSVEVRKMQCGSKEGLTSWVQQIEVISLELRSFFFNKELQCLLYLNVKNNKNIQKVKNCFSEDKTSHYGQTHLFCSSTPLTTNVRQTSSSFQV